MYYVLGCLLFCVLFFFLGRKLGFKQSQEDYARRVSEGIIIYKITEGEGEGGWDGTDEALLDIRKWTNGEK